MLEQITPPKTFFSVLVFLRFPGKSSWRVMILSHT